MDIFNMIYFVLRGVLGSTSTGGIFGKCIIFYRNTFMGYFEQRYLF